VPSRAVRLRALAHPLRWKLLDLLESGGPATATECARASGESVASCAYHLGILGKYGYLERAPAVGRERPWRLAERRQDLSATGGAQERRAAAAATDAFLAHELERIASWTRRRADEPAPWREATGLGGSTVWATAEELAALREELLARLTRFAPRDADPGARPPGAREARLFFALVLRPPP